MGDAPMKSVIGNMANTASLTSNLPPGGYVMKLIYTATLLLSVLGTTAWANPADAAPVAGFMAKAAKKPAAKAPKKSPAKAKDTDEEKERNVQKAAREKRKELKDAGVKNIRVKSPDCWPKKIPVPANTELTALPHKEGDKEYVYESNNYSFHSPVPIGPESCKTIGRLFECAFAANRAIAKVLPVERASKERTEKKYKVILCRTRAEYHARGGNQGSDGMFTMQASMPPISGDITGMSPEELLEKYGKGEATIPLTQTPTQLPDAAPLNEEQIHDDYVLVPFEALGMDENGKIVKNDIKTHTLVHELTHQNFALNRLNTWGDEGWAEYVGYVPYVGEDLDFDRCFAVILHEAQKVSGQGGLHFTCTLEQFLRMPQQEMYACMGKGQNSYLLSAMLITFFVHLDGNRGVNAIRAYMKALREGKPKDEAVDTLMASYKGGENLQKAFMRDWSQRKVDGLSFQGAAAKPQKGKKK